MCCRCWTLLQHSLFIWWWYRHTVPFYIRYICTNFPISVSPTQQKRKVTWHFDIWSKISIVTCLKQSTSSSVVSNYQSFRRKSLRSYLPSSPSSSSSRPLVVGAGGGTSGPDTASWPHSGPGRSTGSVPSMQARSPSAMASSAACCRLSATCAAPKPSTFKIESKNWNLKWIPTAPAASLPHEAIPTPRTYSHEWFSYRYNGFFAGRIFCPVRTMART